LVSVFIDNLNPVVDHVGVWGIFKPLGRIRDVFLSSKVRTRRSCYAFLRFGTLDEANKVAAMVNGMHVYRWTISAKVADFGWNNRRSPHPANRRDLIRRIDRGKESRNLFPG
jgi:hypothetical protein